MAQTQYEYAFNGHGGFSAERGFENVFMNLKFNVNQVDTYDAVRISIPASLLTQKLGAYDLYEADGDRNPTDTSGGFQFQHDNIVLNARELVSTDTSVNDVGSLSTLYTDFRSYVMNWLSAGNFINLFDASSTIPEVTFVENDLHSIIFSAQAQHLIDGSYVTNVKSDVSGVWDSNYSLTGYPGQYCSLSGDIYLNNVNELLVSAQTNDYFGNRVQDADTANSTVDISGGFLPGDRIFILDGLTVNFNVNILQNGIAYSQSGLYNTINPNNNDYLLPDQDNRESHSSSLVNQLVTNGKNLITGETSAHTNIFKTVTRNLIITLV